MYFSSRSLSHLLHELIGEIIIASASNEEFSHKLRMCQYALVVCMTTIAVMSHQVVTYLEEIQHVYHVTEFVDTKKLSPESGS